jgi:hypothetical protein
LLVIFQIQKTALTKESRDQKENRFFIIDKKYSSLFLNGKLQAQLVILGVGSVDVEAERDLGKIVDGLRVRNADATVGADRRLQIRVEALVLASNL